MSDHIKREEYTKADTFAGSAGAGSLVLEFATLSRLTGDDRFEKAAYKVCDQVQTVFYVNSFQAFFGIWNRKSDIGLVGNTIDTRTGVSLNNHPCATSH